MNFKNKTFIIGILAAAILLAVGLACSSSDLDDYGTKLEFNGGDLYYTNNVTPAEAQKLGSYMISAGFFNGRGKSVQLDKSGSTYQFRMVVTPEMQNNEEYLTAIKSLAADVSKDVFNKAPVEVHICDDEFKTLRVVKP